MFCRLSGTISSFPAFKLRPTVRISLEASFRTTTAVKMPPKRVAVKRKAVQITLDGTPLIKNEEVSVTPQPAPKAIHESPFNGAKRPKLESSADEYKGDPLRKPHHRAQETSDSGIVLRKYYPAEMCNARALAYNTNALPRPAELLEQALQDTKAEKEAIQVKNAVVHWFKGDLRTMDNHALHLAGEKAKSSGASLIAMYIISPQDFEAHLTSPARVDFILRTLEVLKEDLGKLDIPLYVETVEKRRNIPIRIEKLMAEWGAKHLYANVEYEVDELRREARMVRDFAAKGIALEVVPDTCVVSPGELQSGTGKQYSVYSPWFRTWIAYLHSHPRTLDLFPPPAPNPQVAREKYASLFETPIPEAPLSKYLTEEDKARLRPLWPAGEHEAQARLRKFSDEKIHKYQDHRNFPSVGGTSSISVHLSAGTLSARTAVRTARDANTTKKLDSGNPGITTWISEVAWRDFYKHVLVNWPYVCMNKPYKPEYTNIEWSYDMELFEKWATGTTGYPIVDAGMRQMLAQGYMANRCRMIVASFLAKDLLIDWRLGEKFFMEHLIDGDFASNNGGWGFSASTGVDPQPYFRIFNPLLQSEKFDKDGEYIRRWVPELRGISDKAIHEPYERGAGAIAQKAGYPRKCVDHKVAREVTLKRYKEGLGRDTA